MTLYTNIKTIYTPTGIGNGNIETIENGAIAVVNGQINWVGRLDAIPEKYEPARVVDCTNLIATPGLIDPHTHLVFAGDRSDEFIQRLAGVSYTEIAALGGGIRATVRATRTVTEHDLHRMSRPRVQRFINQGVTTLEIKSGYGLDTETELKQLRVIRKLNNDFPIDIVATFLGAHEIPDEYREDKKAYIDLIKYEMLPAIVENNLADQADVFCETGVFSVDESREILTACKNAGLDVKVHADELSPLGGAELAAELNALSADHLLCITDKGIKKMAKAGTVATLLPGTAFFLKLDYAPARKIIDAGIPVAVSTDFNPGSSTIEHIGTIFLLSSMYMGMSPEEILTAVTINAAKALNRETVTGMIKPGLRADLAFWNAPSWNHIIYHYSHNHAQLIIANGKTVFEKQGVSECRSL